ncbi:MAG: MFS transporter [Dehalococcoidia bacterium]
MNSSRDSSNPTARSGVTGSKSRKSGWMIIAAGFLLTLILYGAYYSFGVFLKPMLNDLGWTRGATTGAASLYLVIHGAFAIFMGHLSDRYGPRWVIIGGTLLIALGYSLISLMTSLWHLYIFLGILVGTGMGAAYVPPLATAAKWFNVRRGLALGVVAAGVGVGQIVLPPLLKYLIAEVGWRDAFVVLGVATAGLGIPAALMLRNPPDAEGEIRQPGSHDTGMNQLNSSAIEALKTRSFWLLLGVFTSLVFGINIIMQHLVAHVEDNGFDPVPAALVLTLIGISGIFGRIISGGAADRIGSKAMTSICMILQIAVFYSLIVTDELWAFYTAGIFYGIGYGGTLPLIIKMSSDFFGTYSGGAIFGVLLFGASIGGAVGVPLAGYIYDSTGDYAIAFIIAGSVIVLGFFINIILQPPDVGKIESVRFNRE